MTGPPSPPPPPGWPGPPPPPAGPPQRPARPADVDTGFWLWLAALPLMTVGYVVTTLTSPEVGRALYPAVGVVAVLVCTFVLLFLVLMRSGYRWARTALTGGGIAAVVYAVSGLFEPGQQTAVAVARAVTGIVGSVLIAGGTFVLHRGDTQAYFTR